TTPTALLNTGVVLLHSNIVITRTTPSALHPPHTLTTQGSPRYRSATLGYQKYNAYSVAEYLGRSLA
ncbi:MAG: hypothetical protein HXO06_03840, partial [Prevotella salivae]|nr:hypothetical protein [Segatella salivae]